MKDYLTDNVTEHFSNIVTAHYEQVRYLKPGKPTVPDRCSSLIEIVSTMACHVGDVSY